MAVTHNLYAPGQKNIMNGTIDLVADTIKVALMTSDFTFTVTDEDFVDTHECTDTDYTTGGEILPIVSGDITTATNTVTVDTSAADSTTVFTAEGDITASYAVIYDSTPATPKLISCVDFDGQEQSVSGEFKITWHNDGLFTVTVNPA